MTCHLCKATAPLRASHIIPEFFYRPGYDAQHRLQRYYRGNPKPGVIQKGLRESLLCDDCETYLNHHYERAFKTYWYDEAPLPDTIPTHSYPRSGVDYPTFKLLLLSVLWRAGIARGPVFSRVVLGPYEDTLRSMLLARDPGPASQFQIFGGIVVIGPERAVCSSLITAPIRTRVSGQQVYGTVFGGVFWQFVVGRGVLADMLPYSLSENGHIHFAVQDIHLIRPLARFMRETNPPRRAT